MFASRPANMHLICRTHTEVEYQLCKDVFLPAYLYSDRSVCVSLTHTYIHSHKLFKNMSCHY